MGPCLFRHGNQVNTHIGYQIWVASMGPCLFRHGNCHVLTVGSCYIIASMGPCLFRHGNLHHPKNTLSVYPASMGPCLFRHGNLLWPVQYHMQIYSFNGAVPFQARKSNPAAHTTQYHYSLQWGRAFSGTEIVLAPCNTGNNGHASMGPCLFRHGNGLPRGHTVCRLLASMGPCLFRHGNSLSGLMPVRWIGSFNGAVPFQARKSDQ